MQPEPPPSQQPDTATRGRRSALGSLDTYAWIFIVLICLTLISRLWGLADKPFHHDESIHGWYSWMISEGKGYSYDPVYHGPVQLFLMALAYLPFGSGDFAARLFPAIMGAVIVGLPFLLRRQIGKGAALVAAMYLAISPSFWYYSRFAREDIYFATITLAMMGAILAFLNSPKKSHPSLILGLLALSFATKESAFISLFIVCSFLAALTLGDAWRAALRDSRIIAGARSLGKEAWMWGAIVFLIVFTALFTSFFTHLDGFTDGAFGGLRYWLGQHPVHRGNQVWYFYIVLLIGYEWPIVLVGAYGLWRAVRRGTVTDIFLVWWFASSLAIYSWAGERMPWLVLHSLLPLILLAARGIEDLWERRARVRLALAGLTAVYLIVAGAAAAYWNSADPRELILYTQTGTGLKDALGEFEQIDAKTYARTGQHLNLWVDSAGGASWPWAWYLRDTPNVGYADLSAGALDSKDVDAVFILDTDRAASKKALSGYVGHEFNHRIWWVPDYGAASPTDWARWIFQRKAWSETGSLKAWLYVRDSLPGAETLTDAVEG
jgi:uncharacterized protein (TIGR03663 family)